MDQRKLAEEYRNARVTIMGLGLHGGGVASARFFARLGARVTVTDLRGPEVLAPSLKALEGLDIHYVLGQHRDEDFAQADFVIKNPAVRPDSPYLQKAHRVETDISIFLAHSASPLIAVTGSKGKSTTASALAHVLKESGRPVLLGGNITVSPLDFLDKTSPEVTVVLELSSWQLGDLRNRALLKPRVAILTCIYPDHLNYYGTMEAYVADKKVLFDSQTNEEWAVCNLSLIHI
ncbi:MAG: Mur ligase family protein, partial [Rectinema sp.]|nr:Mur ligase family protein [Rectinema sp.]